MEIVAEIFGSAPMKIRTSAINFVAGPMKIGRSFIQFLIGLMKIGESPMKLLTTLMKNWVGLMILGIGPMDFWIGPMTFGGGPEVSITLVGQHRQFPRPNGHARQVKREHPLIRGPRSGGTCPPMSVSWQ